MAALLVLRRVDELASLQLARPPPTLLLVLDSSLELRLSFLCGCYLLLLSARMPHSNL